MENDGISLAELFKNIWFYKFSLVIFVVLSVPISVYFSTTRVPTYKAETVFEKPGDNTQSGNSLLSNIEGLGILRVLGGATTSSRADSFFSDIRSESFLEKVILNNADFDSQMLAKFCPLPSKETSRFSLKSLLISLGLSENRAPSKGQKISLLVKCVNKMMEIDFDKYDGSNESSAYRLSIESRDPKFSANLANQIVEKYFVHHEARKDEDFKSVKRYLSKIIAVAQREFIEAKKSIQQFRIKHTLLMNTKPLSGQNASTEPVNFSELSIPVSPFAPELNKEINNLSQLEKSISQLKQARLNLLSLKEIDREKMKVFISSTDVQGVLSRTFITAISKINNLPSTTNVMNQEIKKIVDRELMSLKQKIKGLEEKINKGREQTKQLMNIENKFQELAVDVAKKRLLFEGLKDQLKEKIISSGLANIREPILLTKAVPPFNKASPNRQLIVALGVLLAIFIGISYVLIRQLAMKRVHSLSQLQKISRSLSLYGIKYKQLKNMSERSEETAVGQSFFSHIMGTDKLGCIIDISQKSQKNSLASEFSTIIVSLLEKGNSKIVSLGTLPSKKLFSASPLNKFASNPSDLDVTGVSNESIISLNDEDGMIVAGEVRKIKDKYSDFDKILCALSAEIGDLTKFKFIEQCDFYILIGRSFQFDEYTFKKFSNTVLEKEKKCIGFFLID